MLLFFVNPSQSFLFCKKKFFTSLTGVRNKSHHGFNYKLPLSVASQKKQQIYFGVESGSIGWRRSMTNYFNDDDNDAYDRSQFQYLDDKGGKIKNLLVCGDGDLSFSASIASNLASKKIQLTATVLENKKEHEKIYKNSCSNTQSIRFSSVTHNSKNTMATNAECDHLINKVFFGIDATNLQRNLQDAIQNEQGVTNNHTDNQHFPVQNNALSFDRIQFNLPHWKGKSNHKHNR